MKIHTHPSFSSHILWGGSKVSACRWTSKIVRLDLTRWWQLALLQVGIWSVRFFSPNPWVSSCVSEGQWQQAQYVFQQHSCDTVGLSAALGPWKVRGAPGQRGYEFIQCQPVQAALALLRGSMSVDAVCDLVASCCI